MTQDYGSLIKKRRDELGLTLMEAAEQISQKYNVRLTYSYLSQIENGKKHNLTTRLKQAIDDFYSIPETETLFEESWPYTDAKILHRAGTKLTPSKKKLILSLVKELLDEEENE